MAEDTDTPKHDIFDDAKDVVENSRRLADDVEEMYEQARETASLRELYEKNPYAVLAAAAGTGYLLGGGLFTPFTKRILKTGMKALVVPLAVSRLRELTQATAGGEIEDLEEEMTQT